MGNPKFTQGIRMVAGVYLIYLAYQVIRDGLIGGGMTGRNFWIGLVGVIVFIGAGLYFAIRASKEMMRLQREDRERLAQEAAEEAAEKAENAAYFRQMKGLEDHSDGDDNASGDDISEESASGEDTESNSETSGSPEEPESSE
ncbi:MAG: hypothetical protein IJ860_06085 [Eubacterium sp.]|nr:hypothetical protein [Eubacterium sp.]